MTAWLSLWWVWVALAAALGVAEILMPSFMALGFAIGAMGVAGLVAVLPDLSPAVLLIVFALLSLVAWLALRRLFALPSGQVKTFDHDIND